MAFVYCRQLSLTLIKCLPKHCPTFSRFQPNYNLLLVCNYTLKRNMTTKKLPGIVASWDFRTVTPEQVSEQTQDLITRARAIYDQVANVPLTDVSYDSVVKPLADVERMTSTLGSPLSFPQAVALDKALRDAGMEAERLIEEFEVEMEMRKDVFDKIVAFQEKNQLDNLSAEAKRFVERLIKLGRRNGLHLPQETQDRIKAIKKRISELGIIFQRSLNEETTFLTFTDEELAGVPEDFIANLEKDENGKRKVTLKYPHFFPVTRRCRVPATRKLLETAYQARCIKENTPILEELIALRSEQATLLSYPSHAAYVQEMRMAQNPENVAKFLNELAVKLQPLWAKERESALQFKKEECEKYGYEYNSKLDFWDIRYYSTLLEERLYAVDQEVLKNYFPMDVVTQGLLAIYQQLLGLIFTEETEAEKWHDEVRVFRVNDASSNQLMGYFFLDLYPRDGKFGHAAVFPVQPSCLDENGDRQVAVAAMVANFTKPTAEKPSLLDHKEVETYFHEFGHVMHGICSQAELAKFSGTRVERDFVEAPSQMLENWVWEKEPLMKLSGHYQTGEKLPEELVKKLVESKKANAGAFNLRQIVLARFDQAIHTRAHADTAQLFTEIYKEVMGIDTIPGTNMPANFGHLAGGYDAQYYGYLWSEVYSADMFETRFKADNKLMDPERGFNYRKCILAPGGSTDAADMLRNFLGREPSQEAFLKSKGIEV